jgi:integrase
MIKSRQLSSHWTKMRKPLGAGTFHEFRHGQASLFGSVGVNVKVIQERLGHSDPRVTLSTYTHLLAGMQEDAAEKFDAALRVVKAGKRM